MEKIKQWIVAHKVWSIVIASVLVVAIALSIALPLALRHKHTYSEDWSTDASYHWHACTGKDCDSTSDKAEHTFVDNSNDTQYWLECSVCGYEQEKIDATVDSTTLANALDFKDADGNDYTNWQAEKIGSDSAGGREVKFRVKYTGDAYQAYNLYATTNQEVLYINSYNGENEVRTVYKKNAGEDWTKTELSGHSNVQGLAKQCLKLTEFMGGLTFEYNSADKAYCATKPDGTPTEKYKQEYTYKLFFENGKLVSVQSIRTGTEFATDTEAEKVRILDEYTWIISYGNATYEIPTVSAAE